MQGDLNVTIQLIDNFSSNIEYSFGVKISCTSTGEVPAEVFVVHSNNDKIVFRCVASIQDLHSLSTSEKNEKGFWSSFYRTNEIELFFKTISERVFFIENVNEELDSLTENLLQIINEQTTEYFLFNA